MRLGRPPSFWRGSVANAHYRLGARHAGRPYNPGPYRVVGRAAQRSAPVVVTGAELAEATAESYARSRAGTERKATYAERKAEQDAADLAAVRAGTATPAQRSRVWNRWPPTEAELQETEMRDGIRA